METTSCIRRRVVRSAVHIIEPKNSSVRGHSGFGAFCLLAVFAVTVVAFTTSRSFGADANSQEGKRVATYDPYAMPDGNFYVLPRPARIVQAPGVYSLDNNGLYAF